MTRFARILLVGAAVALAGQVIAAPVPAAKLERVVMLMRHGIRPPTKAQPVPAKYSPDAWPAWPVAPGLLTHRGAKGIALLGGGDRAWLVKAGLLPARGCPVDGSVTVLASGKQRAIRTAEEWSKALLPGCTTAVDHPTETGPDPIFHGLDDQPAGFDGHRAWVEAMKLAPPGGLAEEARDSAAHVALLEKVLGCVAPACDLEHEPTILVENPHDRPDLEGPLDIGSTASQSFLLEYLEGMPMRQVGWGRVTRPEIEQLLAFHPIKFRYGNRPASVARYAGRPLIERMSEALQGRGAAGRVTLLAGHDTNLADLAALMDLHWKVPSYPADDIPPGSAVGFELWRPAKGAPYVRAFYRAQTMDQLRTLQPLDGRTRAYRQYLPIPGCGTVANPASCTLSTFNRTVARRLQP